MSHVALAWSRRQVPAVVKKLTTSLSLSPKRMLALCPASSARIRGAVSLMVAANWRWAEGTGTGSGAGASCMNWDTTALRGLPILPDAAAAAAVEAAVADMLAQRVRGNVREAVRSIQKKRQVSDMTRGAEVVRALVPLEQATQLCEK